MRSLVHLSLAVALALAGATAPAGAWTPATQKRLALEAAALAPTDLQRQIERHQDRLLEGALAPFRSAPAEDHYWHKDGAGNLDRRLFVEVQATIDAVRNHRPFSEIVWRLGVVAHYVADANNPLNSDAGDPLEGRYFADYLRYAQSAEGRFALVFYAEDPPVDSDQEMRLMVYRSLYRGRQLYPLVGTEYRRIGFASGIGSFDDRSTAFGVAAVSYSHAVSDIARIFRYIWLEAGGADDEAWLWAHRDGLLLLTRQPRAAK